VVFDARGGNDGASAGADVALREESGSVETVDGAAEGCSVGVVFAVDDARASLALLRGAAARALTDEAADEEALVVVAVARVAAPHKAG
jgi:hypothetical protein